MIIKLILLQIWIKKYYVSEGYEFLGANDFVWATWKSWLEHLYPDYKTKEKGKKGLNTNWKLNFDVFKELNGRSRLVKSMQIPCNLALSYLIFMFSYKNDKMKNGLG